MSARLGRRSFLLASSGGAAALLLPSWLDSARSAHAQTTEKSILARVLIRRADSSVDAATLVITGDGEFAATDGKGERVARWSARKQVTVGREGDAFWVQEGENKIANLTGPLKFNGTGDGAPLRNQATSGPEPTAFRGTLEVTASPGGVALLNVLGIEEYLYGVVTKELPAFFGQEPLKAQAVAARTYTLARRLTGAHKAQNADICDTQHCQAFGALQGEHPLGRQAVDATRGVVMYVGGAYFQPFYSSACGGHTEAAASIFGGGGPQDADAVEDGELPAGVKLASDDGALKFFKNGWDSNCSGSNRYRWSYTWDADQLKSIVNGGIARFQGTATVAGEGDARVEQLENVSVPERGASGRALSVRFEAPGVSWTVKRDWGIRNFLRTPEGDLLPSSAVGFEIERGPDKKLTKLTAFGAGWGHGAGMCQWGTKGLAARGVPFDGILGHYYPSAELGQIKG
ncbi:MAG: SpoIID/LytB domain-containing protein [Chloroflexi bacterium]|nr:SpoIID/LytB domain-containing protein [Chloroflexota bacterium]